MFGFNKANKEAPEPLRSIVEMHKAKGLSIAITAALNALIEKYDLPEDEAMRTFMVPFQNELEEYSGADKGEFSPR